jgi:hypothetical protein
MHCHVRCLSTAYSYPWSWGARRWRRIACPFARASTAELDGCGSESTTGADAKVPRQNALSPDGLIVQLLRTKP